jgi:ribulose kinase
MTFMIFAGCPIVLPRESESVLLGAAILGAVATKKYNSLREAMKALSAAGQVWTPFFQSLFTLYINFY